MSSSWKPIKISHPGGLFHGIRQNLGEVIEDESMNVIKNLQNDDCIKSRAK